jgi:subtilase family serine protease
LGIIWPFPGFLRFNTWNNWRYGLRFIAKQLASPAKLGRAAAFALIALTAQLMLAQSGPQDRITAKIDNQARVSLGQGVHPLVQTATDEGQVSSDFQIERATLELKLSAAQQSDLTALLEQLNSPLSDKYHQWLTPEEFGKRFGASQNDIAKITAWLKSYGLTVQEVPAARTRIIFGGPASVMAAAFGTEIHAFQVNGESRYANTKAATVPAAMGSVVSGVHGLYNFRMKPRGAIRRVAAPKFTSSLSGNHYVAPEDFATIYDVTGLYNSSITGTGQKIAVVGQSNIYLTDVEAFRTASGLAANDPTLLLVPGSSNPGYLYSSGDMGESSLDVEWSGAIAKSATIIFVYSTDVTTSLQYAVDNDVAPVISISYGECEASAKTDGWATQLTSLGQQANTQGQTILAASGDDGAADCDTTAPATGGLAVDMPASLPYVTGMGGTEFNEGTGTYWSSSNDSSNGSALSYIPEVAWNDSSGSDISASGGGASIIFSKPSWQTGTGVPSDGMRDVPDLAVSASADHDGYLVCVKGSCVNGYRDASSYLTVYGGTSVGAPTFAGIVALINQKMGASQGNVNPWLYALAASTSYSSLFHDITSGNNDVTCRSGSTNCSSSLVLGYSAGTGYDQATGLGSMDAAALAAAWGSAVTIAPASTSLSVSHGSSVTDVLTFNSPASYTITLSCSTSGLPTGTTCGLSSTTLTGSGTSTLTVTVPATSGALRPHRGGWQALGTSAGFVLAGGVFCGFGRRRKLVRRRAVLLLMLALALSVAGLSLACGGRNSSTSSSSSSSSSSSTTGTVTVVATAGSVTRNLAITVTVN